MTKINVKRLPSHLECKMNDDGCYEMRIEDHENYSEDSLLVKEYIEELDTKIWFPVPVHVYKENVSDIQDQNGAHYDKVSVTRFVFDKSEIGLMTLFKVIRISKGFVERHKL